MIMYKTSPGIAAQFKGNSSWATEDTREDPYLQRAQDAIDSARKRLPHYRGSCSGCAYSRENVVRLTCVHPAVELVAFNLTDGYNKRRIVRCDEQRNKSSNAGPVVCGPNGALFEKRRGLLARFFRDPKETS